MSQPTILFVDDESSVLRALQRTFRKEPLNVLTAENGAKGLALFEQHAIHVVISDQRMPDMCGTDFLKEVRTKHPDTVRCILSGYAEMNAVVAAINDGNVYRFIAKPWDDSEILAVLRECVLVAESTCADRRARASLEKRASELEAESAMFADVSRLQESLLKSSREVLNQLPIAVAVLDPQGRMIYTNRRFTNAFGHSQNTLIGQPAGEPWTSAANDCVVGDTEFEVDNSLHNAQVGRIEIGGQQHTLIAISPDRQ